MSMPAFSIRGDWSFGGDDQSCLRGFVLESTTEMTCNFIVLNMCYIMCYAVDKCLYFVESITLSISARVQSHDSLCVKTRKIVCKDTKVAWCV